MSTIQESKTAAATTRSASVRPVATAQAAKPAPSLGSIQPATARKAIAQQAILVANGSQVAALKVIEDHFTRLLTHWANVKDARDFIASQTSISIPLAALTGSNMPAQWKTQFSAAGYVISDDGRTLRISQPQPQ